MGEGFKWFRLYSEIINDDKIRLLAFEDRWHFVAIMCMKASGVLDEADADLRWQRIRVNIGLSESDLEKMLDRLAKVKLIDRKTLEPLAWDRRQFKSDRDETANDRKRLERARKKQAATDVTDESRVTSQTGHGQVTLSETETETERERETLPAAEIRRKASRFALASPPDDWIAFCQETRPDLECLGVFARFRDHWIAKPGKDGTKLDWAATWRNWVRNERPGPIPIRPLAAPERDDGRGPVPSNIRFRDSVDSYGRKVVAI